MTSRKASSFPSGSAFLHELFEARAKQQPARVATRCGGEQLSYGELEARATRVADALVEMGVRPGDLVAVYLDRSCRTIEAILGVLKAGGAYVPIDAAYPEARIRWMLADARPAAVVTDAALEPAVPKEWRTVSLDGGPGFKICGLQQAEAGRSVQDRWSTGLAEAGRPAYVIYTSGSTGTPKGVVVTHENVIRLFTSTNHWFGFGPGDVWTLFHSLAFDFSVWEMWGALLYGGTLVVVPRALARSPAAFYQLLAEEGVTVLNQTPSAFRQLLAVDELAGKQRRLRLRWIVFGGEALDLAMLRPWFERHGDREPRLVNMYGITETTVHVTYRPIRWSDVESKNGSVIGQPIPDLSLHILDVQRRPCPMGVAGEIYVGGRGVAAGYLRRPELTAERFIPDPFDEESSARLYRSGDLGRHLPDGDIEYLGRIDQQVKIRGFRIELGEIESALNGAPGVREAAVVARARPDGDRQLVAYLVCDKRPAVDLLRASLEQLLPEHMVPAHYVFLSRLPLTDNGKLDRKALPPPANERPDMETPFIPPATAEEKILAEILEDVLQVRPVGVNDNFFTLGGDSIRSIQVLARAAERGLRITVEELFERPTIRELGPVGRTGKEENGPRFQEAFSGIADADRPKLPAALSDAYPMARLQVGMVYHTQRAPGSAIFHDVFSFRLRLPWDERRLEQAIQRLAARHAILRTSFDLGSYSEPLQLVHEQVSVPLSIENLRALSPEEQKLRLVDWIEEEKRRPFDWGQAPFLRLHVQRYGDDVFQLIVSFHHVIMDGWSLAALLTELLQDYVALQEGKEVAVSGDPVTYRDFVWLEKEAIASLESREFWKRQLVDATIAALPRWPGHLCHSGREQVRGPELVVEPAVLAGLKRLAASVGAPLRTVLLAAHCRVMGLVTGQTDVVTGLVANGRPQVKGGERLLGLFLNTLPFRVTLSGGTWQDLVQAVFAVERELMPHRRCPLAEIQQWTGGQALFETVFDFVQFHVYRELVGYGEESFVEGHYFEANNFTFYQTFMLEADGSKLQMHCDYDPNVLSPEQVKALGDYYLQALMAMAEAGTARYEEGCLLPDWERTRLLFEWNRTERHFGEEMAVHECIEAQARKAPGDIAVRFRTESLTYGELDRRCAALAAQLRTLGVGPGVLVGVHLPRSLTMLVGVLAILRAGGAYVPLDPSYPAERLRFMAEDAKLKILLTGDEVPEWARHNGREVVCAARFSSTAQPLPAPATTGGGAGDLGQLAYVIYTSGSTGQPKGVEITHRALANLLQSMRRQPGLDAADTLLAVTTLSFDIAALELFLPLTVGGQVIIASLEEAQSPAKLADILQRHEVTVMQATPATWRMLVQTGWAGSTRLKALCGGEALTRELADALSSRCGELWNMYGPTETTIWSCVHRMVSDDRPVSVGRPIWNTEAYILDPHRQLVPIGTPGELYLGGTGLARGYLGQPELTAEKFVTHPFRSGSSARLYRTGDRAQFQPDGTLICLGRTDHQVKIRGFRIELGEIESALRQHPAVAGAVVQPKDASGGEQQLVAYYLLEPGQQVQASALKHFLAERLPGHMLPAIVIELTAFPLTPNGKIDRRRLPEPGKMRPDLPIAFVGPRTPLEARLANLWAEVLPVDRVGVRDSFFALGGHSLLAIRLVSRLRQEFDLDVSVSALFKHPTVEALALELMRLLVESEANSTEPAPALATAGRSIRVILLCLFLLSGVIARGQTSFLDRSFDPGTGAGDGIVESVLPVADGQVLVCGNFLSINGVDRAFVARLNGDGSVDTNFTAHAGYWVRQMALQADGKIVIGGFFTNVEGIPRNRIARLNADGSLDRTFDPGTGAETKIVEGDDKDPFVFAVVVQPDGKIVIAGNFRTYNGIARSGLARLNTDGTLDKTFEVGAGFDSWGRFLLLLPNDQILATGWFTSYNNQPFNRMVRLNHDGTADASFKPFFGDKTAIYGAVLLPDGKLVAGGHSINDQGLFRQELARLNVDGSFDTNFQAVANEKVESLCLQPDGKIILGGYFSIVNGVARNGLARLNPNGTLDETFRAEADNFVWTVRAQAEDKVLVCGGFLNLDGVSRRGVARLTVDSAPPPPAAELEEPVLKAGRFTVQMPTDVGKRYILQHRDLDSTRWTSPPAVDGTGATLELADPDAGLGGGRIYRVRID